MSKRAHRDAAVMLAAILEQLPETRTARDRRNRKAITAAIRQLEQGAGEDTALSAARRAFRRAQ